MIDKRLQPVEWSEFMYELEDALEHLGKLTKDVDQVTGYDDDTFRVDLGHIYAHLNRAWRRSAGALADHDREWATRFPDDLAPIG